MSTSSKTGITNRELQPGLLPGAENRTQADEKKKINSNDQKTATDTKTNLTRIPKINPSKVSNIVSKAAPILSKILEEIEKARPHVEKFLKEAVVFYERYLGRYHTTELSSFIFGYVLLFFGGSFAMTIACYTAIKLSGWDTLKENLGTLYESYKVSREAINNDLKKELDTDGDGNVSAVELAQAMKKTENINKLVFTLLGALDPNKILKSVEGIWLVILSVMATLRTKFAQQITIGANVGRVFQETLEIWVEPKLLKFLESINPDFTKWSNFIIVAATRFVCILISILLTRVISAYHSALKGADIVSRVSYSMLVQYKVLSPDNEKWNNQLRSTFMNFIAFYGFYAQLSSGFSVVWYLRILLFPALLLESFLASFAYYAI